MAVRAISSSNNTSNVSSVSNSTSNNSSILNSSVSLINSVTNSLPANQTTPTTNSKPTLVSSTPSKTQQNNLSVSNVSPAGSLHQFNSGEQFHFITLKCIVLSHNNIQFIII